MKKSQNRSFSKLYPRMKSNVGNPMPKTNQSPKVSDYTEFRFPQQAAILEKERRAQLGGIR